MSNRIESADFYHELETKPLDDYETISESKTKHPFSENFKPQGALSGMDESFEPVKKYHYVERRNHGRSIDETASSAKVLWGGEFQADKFGARDLKGSRQEQFLIDIRQSQHGYNEIRIKGLYDETDVEYLVKASEYLREIGLPTEKITAIYKPNEILYQGEPVPVDEWKKLAKARFARQTHKGTQGVILIQDVNKFIDNSEFFQVERELQISERIRDLAFCTTEDEFKRVLSGPLNWINVATKIKHEGIIPGTEQPDPFDINKTEDIERYLESWLPGQMGNYLGRMKKAGIQNKYGHAQQWSLAATMYDTQSLIGEPLNGKKLTAEDYVYALQEALGVLEELLNPERPNYISQHFGNCLAQAKQNLLVNYFKEIDLVNDMDINDYDYEDIAYNNYFDGRKESFRLLDPDTYIKVMEVFGAKFPQDRIEEMYKYHKIQLDKIAAMKQMVE